LIVYLACGSDNQFFIGCVRRAIENFNRTHRFPFQAFSLVFPPERIGGDLGKVLLNVLRIREANIVIADLTPQVSAARDLTSYNSGTMIELGLVIAEENRKTPHGELDPWGGKFPRPSVRLFGDSRFHRRDLTPLLNEYSVTPYAQSPEGEASLLAELDRILNEMAQQAFGAETSPSPDFGAFQASGAGM